MTLKSHLMAGHIRLLTAAERAKGRPMRAPDGHGEGGGEGGGGGGGLDLAALPDSLDDINAVPERLRGLYVKEGEKFVYKDPAALRNALETTRTERNTYRQRAGVAAELEGLGLTIDEIRQLKEQRDNAETERLKKEGDFDSLKEQLETNFQNKEKGWQERERKLLKALETNMVDADARAVLAEEDLQGNPTLLLPHIRGRVKLVETDDGFERQVLTPDGKSPMLNADSKPATLRDLFTELKAKPEFSGAFKGVNQSGGGTPPNGGGGGTPPAGSKRSEMTPLQRVSYIEQHGQEAYLKLPA
jgi:FtsZ-binding cell division protein ZapB